MSKLRIGNISNDNLEEEKPISVVLDKVLGLQKNNILTFMLEGKLYSTNITDLFSLSLDDQGQYSEIEMEYNIQNAYPALISFKVSRAQMNRNLKNVKEDFKRWLSQQHIEKLKKLPERTSDSKVLNYILGDNQLGPVYLSKKQQIHDLEYRIEIIDSVIDTLSKRVESLRSLLKNREQVKGRQHGF